MDSLVYVVHCIDTEGPLGGDARRWPDGSPEFFDNWDDIMVSLREITADAFRESHADSFGNPYLYNWFLMDFTGFKTNPKNKVTEYNDTCDHIASLPTSSDRRYWHYHHPPADGVGDRWSDDWDSSQEYENILCHRLIDRHDFPEAFRAGGTIEDNKCSNWLESNVMIDYSNRVSNRSHPTDNIFDFNWFGAPSHWGYYHPSVEDFMKPGSMRRYIARCVDLRSRLNELTQYDVDQCFAMAGFYRTPILLSYFSHDLRDMRPETRDVYDMLVAASQRYDVPWVHAGALEAIQSIDALPVEHVTMDVTAKGERAIAIEADGPIFQPAPYVAVKYGDGRYQRLHPSHAGKSSWICEVPHIDAAVSVGVASTSSSGNQALWVCDEFGSWIRDGVDRAQGPAGG